MSHRELPSLQDLIAKKKEGAWSNPRFLSRKERQQLALHRRQENVKQPLKSAGKQRDIAEKRPIQNEETAKISQKRTKGFKFDWNENEDTFEDNYLPTFEIQNPTEDELFDLKRLQDKHWSAKELDRMTLRDWRILKEDFEITIKGKNASNPLRSWNESKIHQRLLDIISKLGFKEPTPIQRASIPIALESQDILGIAQTGSGKTLAFLIPILTKLLNLPRLNEYTKNEGPYALILVPTRELAQQIEAELQKFLKYLKDIEIISLVGGKLIEKDILDLQNKNIEIIIATPGRLIDCLSNHYLVLNQLKFLILDECDKMIEMNFADQIQQIETFIRPSKRQNMLFTATMTNEVEKISKNYVNDPVIVNIGGVTNKDMIINDRIEQRFEILTHKDENRKVRKLLDILRQYEAPIIIFINYKESGEFLNSELSSKGFKVSLIHGSKSQSAREQAIEEFKSGKTDILIGTNVASRGLDINNVKVVINYQMSRKIDDYIHRVGRTGRAGNFGTAVTFVNEEDDAEIIPDLKKLLTSTRNRVPQEFKKYNIRNIL